MGCILNIHITSKLCHPQKYVGWDTQKTRAPYFGVMLHEGIDMILAEKIYSFFCQYKDEIDLPWFSGFPKNCCESASIFLGKAIKEASPNSDIFYIKGENIDGESHYWLEVNGLVIDITIEQFECFTCPIYSSMSHPLSHEFNVSRKIDIDTAFKEYDSTNDTYKNTLLVNLNYLLREK
tara:strand:+ start:1666 stop:2202 length:537 start_codon:yes stop_codon:yes gene_type:complete